MTKEKLTPSPLANMPRSFRASDGVDAAGKKIVNVGYPDKTVKSDGVSVEYNTYENTIQMHDSTRTYPKDFAVIYQDRLYYSLFEITIAEAFDLAKWQFIRIDVNYRHVLSTVASGAIKIGESILSEVRGADANYILPNNPKIGDAVIIKDIAGVTDDYKINVAGRINNINTGYNINVPNSSTTFFYNGSTWVSFLTLNDRQKCRIISVTDMTPEGYVKSFVGDELMRESRFTGALTVRLPRYAAHGDTVTTYDLDGNNPQNNVSIIVHANSNHTITVKNVVSTSITSSSSSWGRFVFDADDNTWRLFDADQTWRWNIIDRNYASINDEGIFVYARNPTDVINIDFPNRVTVGDVMKINTSYMVVGSTVKLNIPTGTESANLFLMINNQLVDNPRVSYRIGQIANLPGIRTKTYTYVCDGRDIQLDFMYAENPTVPDRAWILSGVHETNFKVDRNNTNSLGISAIATQAEVNKNKENITTGQNRDCETFVTPETLANKLASTTLRGISRIATDAESKATSGTSEAYVSVLITPETLNNRLATEAMRGVARVATQTEANAMTGSGEAYTQKFISPKTLNDRKATVTQTGITRLATQTEVNTGTDNTTIVTPLTLRTISDSRYVNKTGDTMSGNLIIQKTSPAITLTDSSANGFRTDLNFRAASTGELWKIGTTTLLGNFEFGYAGGGSNSIVATIGRTGLISGQQINSNSGVFARATSGTIYIRPSNDASSELTVTNTGVVTTANSLNVKGQLFTLNSTNTTGTRIVLSTTSVSTIKLFNPDNTSHDIQAGTGDLKVLIAGSGALAVTGKLTVSGASTLNALSVTNNTVLNTLTADVATVNSLTTNASTDFNAASNGAIMTAKSPWGGFQIATSSANRVDLNVTTAAGVRSATGIILFNNGTTQLNYASSHRLGTSQLGVSVTGNVSISGTPTLNNDAVTVLYVKEALDDLVSDSNSRVHKQGDVMTGELILNHSPALTANGAVEINDVLTVDTLRIRVGNEYLEIRPNPTTRTVEFVWVS